MLWAQLAAPAHLDVDLAAASVSPVDPEDAPRPVDDLASLVDTCKLNGVDPQRYLADLLTRLVNDWPNSRIDELMPWHWTGAKTA